MRKAKPTIAIIVILAILIGVVVLVVTGKKGQRVAIGTGSEQGVYYAAGGAIAKLFNASTQDHGYAMDVTTSGGSIENINAVISGARQFGIAQSDMQYMAYHGKGKWEGKPAEKLRAMFSLHPEMITLIAAADANVDSVGGLKGKAVSLGTPGSGQYGNSTDVLATAGLTRADVQEENLKPVEFGSMLQDGRVDAVFYTVGHPNGAIKELTAGQRRKVRFVPIEPTPELMETSPYYAVSEIPLKYYPQALNDQPVKTIRMMTTVVTSADVDEELVYQITKSLFEKLDTFRKQHEAFAGLTAEGMTKGLTAPLHPGAERYFKEAGLLEE
ncbi:MAG: TAXI family TRAP transporter solute-binding subunit [Phycisphaerae bacterium]